MSSSDEDEDDDQASLAWNGPPIDAAVLKRNYSKHILSQLLKLGGRVVQLNHHNDYEMSARELRRKAAAIKEQLYLKLNVRAGDIVTVVSESRDDLAALVLGIMEADAIVNPMPLEMTQGT